jgi:uncharacterized membrane protein YbhN (UPF0104 family)
MGDQRQTSKIIWLATKWVVFVVILGFVASHSWTLWNQLGPAPTHLNWSWLALAAVLSIFAWLPSAWYWRWIMGRMGAIAPWPQVMRAYFCGALGKYLPGKAAVVVLRAAMLKSVGVPATTAALAVFHETFTFMWAGGVLTILLYPSMAPYLPEWIATLGNNSPLRVGFLLSCLIAGAVALAMLVHSHRMLHGFFGSRRAGPEHAIGDELPHPAHLSLRSSLRMTLVGGVVLVAGWWIHGLTLGLTICAVIGDRAAWSDWPFWTGTATAAVVGGFVVLFAPGGLGVREGLLLELLERQLGPREAVLVTVMWRGVALAGEIVAAGALYYAVEGVKPVEELKGSGEG